MYASFASLFFWHSHGIFSWPPTPRRQASLVAAGVCASAQRSACWTARCAAACARERLYMCMYMHSERPRRRAQRWSGAVCSAGACGPLKPSSQSGEGCWEQAVLGNDLAGGAEGRKERKRRRGDKGEEVCGRGQGGRKMSKSSSAPKKGLKTVKRVVSCGQLLWGRWTVGDSKEIKSSTAALAGSVSPSHPRNRRADGRRPGQMTATAATRLHKRRCERDESAGEEQQGPAGRTERRLSHRLLPGE